MNITNQDLYAGRAAAKAVKEMRVTYVPQCLTHSAWNILEQIIWLSVFHAVKHQKLTRSCIPSRKYLSGALGLNVATVSVSTEHLEQDGLISKERRRPVLGRWQTKLYRLEGLVLKKAKAVIIEFIKIINRVRLTQHIVPIETKYKDIQRENKVSNPLSKSPPIPDWLVRQSERMQFATDGGK